VYSPLALFGSSSRPWGARLGSAAASGARNHRRCAVVAQRECSQLAAVRHAAARSLIFAFPDPEKTAEKKPLPFDAEHPFRNLGPRVIHAAAGAPPSTVSLSMEEVELTMREHSGTEGFQQLLRPSSLEG